MIEIEVPPGALVILCGPAGSGKSSFARHHFRPTQVVSSDRIREWITDDERHLSSSGDAFEVFHLLIEKRLRWRRVVVADSTALGSRARADLRRLARRAGAPVVLLAFDVPLADAIRRDTSRARPVGPDVVARHRQQFEQALAAIPHEGYDRVYVIRDTGDARVRITRAGTRRWAMFARIVVGLDGSELSDRALTAALELAKAAGGSVLAVHVLPDTVPVMAAAGPVGAPLMAPVMTPEMMDEIREAGEAIVGGARQRLEAAGVEGDARLESGAAAGRLVEVAASARADLIVLGSKGHSRLEELFLGSVSDAVTRRAACSVLVVR